MTWHTIETYFTVGVPVLHSTVSPPLADEATARAAVQNRLDHVLLDHPEAAEAATAAREWAGGSPEVYVGTFAWSVFEAVLDARLSARVHLAAVEKSFTEAVGLPLEIADPVFL